MQALKTDSEILIVGAGPTGLALAAELTRRGTSPLIIDRQPTGVNTSRACVVHPRTLEMLEPLGATLDLLAQGVKVPIFRVRGDRSLITIEFSEIASPYPFTLMCPQDKIEQCLLSHLEELDGCVVRPYELVRCKALASHIEAQVEIEGATKTIKANWLVACNGMHSTVREQSGVALLAKHAIDGIKRDHLEIRPALSNMLKIMSRVAPNCILKQLGKSVDRMLAQPKPGPGR
jgi:2-polyprenyl-6-methoxyphenol hydroxylase-like FAD-dependent oxidoreductase